MSLSDPGNVLARLEQIETDLADRQNALESAARGWFIAKREKEHKHAVAFISAEGTMAMREAIADRETALVGCQEEAEWEALRAVTRTLETRASIGMSLLKSQGRA
jgi:hypothetical protein